MTKTTVRKQVRRFSGFGGVGPGYLNSFGRWLNPWRLARHILQARVEGCFGEWDGSFKPLDPSFSYKIQIVTVRQWSRHV